MQRFWKSKVNAFMEPADIGSVKSAYASGMQSSQNVNLPQEISSKATSSWSAFAPSAGPKISALSGALANVSTKWGANPNTTISATASSA
jgi:hypothetical protein